LKLDCFICQVKRQNI